jgi:Flp pilus assembly protein CpaB
VSVLFGVAPAGRPHPVERVLAELRRALGWRRRLLSAGLLAGAMAVALQVLAPPPPATVPVLVAASDLAAGATLTRADLRVAHRPPASLPAGALSALDAATGRPVSSAVRRGEVLTDVRLVGPGALRGLGPGLVAAPVRVAEPGTAALVRPGDTVDVLAAAAGNSRDVSDVSEAGDATSGGYARLVASAVRVLSVPAPPGGRLAAAPVDAGVLLVVATTSSTAARLAAAAVTDRLSVVLRAPAYRTAGQ